MCFALDVMCLSLFDNDDVEGGCWLVNIQCTVCNSLQHPLCCWLGQFSWVVWQANRKWTLSTLDLLLLTPPSVWAQMTMEIHVSVLDQNPSTWRAISICNSYICCPWPRRLNEWHKAETGHCSWIGLNWEGEQGQCQSEDNPNPGHFDTGIIGDQVVWAGSKSGASSSCTVCIKVPQLQSFHTSYISVMLEFNPAIWSLLLCCASTF